MIKGILIDDEAPARQELRFLLEQMAEVEIIAEFSDGEEALEKIPKLMPDLLFIDIQLPNMSGLELAQRLIRQGLKASVVFATAHDEYALQAFEVNAIDYILKPFDPERVQHTVTRVKKQLQDREVWANKVIQAIEGMETQRKYRKIPAFNNGKVVLVDQHEILYAISEGRHASLVTAEETWPTSLTLQEIEERLDPKQFLRTHRSYLVNVDRIREIIPWFNGTYKLVLNLPHQSLEIPVSRTFVRLLRKEFNF